MSEYRTEVALFSFPGEDLSDELTEDDFTEYDWPKAVASDDLTEVVASDDLAEAVVECAGPWCLKNCGSDVWRVKTFHIVCDDNIYS